MTVRKILKMEDIVKPILEEDEKAREDDFYLYLKVVTQLTPEYAGMKFEKALMYHNELHLPNYKTVERVRRKIQEKYPELASKKRQERLKEEAEYKAYARIS